MFKYLFLVLSLFTLTNCAAGQDGPTVVPAINGPIDRNIVVETPCRAREVQDLGVGQCIIFSIDLPGDQYDIKQFMFDLPYKLRFQTPDAAFVILIKGYVDPSHLRLAIPGQLPVRWISRPPPQMIGVGAAQQASLSFVTHDGGMSWAGYYVPAQLSGRVIQPQGPWTGQHYIGGPSPNESGFIPQYQTPTFGYWQPGVPYVNAPPAPGYNSFQPQY